jgi:hypothetical protein
VTVQTWLYIKQNPSFTDVALQVPVGNGQWQTFHARVDHKMIRDLLMRGGIKIAGFDPEIGFSLGGIWKAVKKVAKATGVSKVLKVASSVLKNPVVTAMFPVASIAARAVESGTHLLNAATIAKKSKDPRARAAAKQLIAQAHQLAAGGDPVAKAGLQVAQRAYKIVVQPL